MRLLVDGVAFQLSEPGIAHFWRCLLPRLAVLPDLEITLLDRGGSPRFSGIDHIEFPSYTFTSTAADSCLIDRFAQTCGADVFTSTHFTSPTEIPFVLIVHDINVGGPEPDLGKNAWQGQKTWQEQRKWQEVQVALSFAQYLLCTSSTTCYDLLSVYPDIPHDRVSSAGADVDRQSNYLRFEDEVGEVCNNQQVQKDEQEGRYPDGKEDRSLFARRQELAWDAIAEEFHRLLKKAVADRNTPEMKRFFAEWNRLRRIQAAVDVS